MARKVEIWKAVLGFIVIAGRLNQINSCYSHHPAPVALEVDGQTYVSCNTPDISRGWIHSGYSVDFKDNNGSTISLRGVEKLLVTNLPAGSRCADANSSSDVRPQGVERDVPLEQTAAAIKAGGKIAQPKVYSGAPPDTLPANFDGWDQPEPLVEGKIYEWEGTEALTRTPHRA